MIEKRERVDIKILNCYFTSQCIHPISLHITNDNSLSQSSPSYVRKIIKKLKIEKYKKTPSVLISKKMINYDLKMSSSNIQSQQQQQQQHHHIQQQQQHQQQLLYQQQQQQQYQISYHQQHAHPPQFHHNHQHHHHPQQQQQQHYPPQQQLINNQIPYHQQQHQQQFRSIPQPPPLSTTPTTLQSRPIQSITPILHQQQHQHQQHVLQHSTSINYLDQERKRFLVELEFVQCLANPNYLSHLAKQGYFKKDEFKNYLKYLLYWKKPEYIKFIKFPECLYFLDLLQQEELYDGITTNSDYVKFISEQQLLHWKYYQTRREQQEQMILLEHQNFYNNKQQPPQLSSSKTASLSSTTSAVVDGLTPMLPSNTKSPITTTLMPFETNTSKIHVKQKK